ncbi:hypothetical protein PV328_006583 [Microctonus aethiopoides]|uniref:Tachykinin n=1 Tax=Microctonus aethiopoides TaxID=144406 RepID=A0AA39FPN5_9HYME|nr:hypothetical protein PV328_006583 [Microctonus aethiopoides]
MGMFAIAIGIGILLMTPHTLGESIPVGKSQFNEIRSKRETTSALTSDEFSKRAPMGFQGTRGKKNIMELNVNDNLIQDDFEKRALMGFQGMRGKKNDVVMPDLNEAFYNDDYEKRAPMGFQGMRGKKTMVEDEYYKRAMMGFQGMRGKKSLEEIYDETQKRNNFGLPDMSSNKMYADEYPDRFDKRVMSMGFQGMRGKKNNYDVIKEWEKRVPIASNDDMRNRQNIIDELENYEKRAIMGFQGMRGKKNDVDSYYNDYELYPLESEKRALMGFHGTRGKRSDDRFFGMRDKRNVRSVALQESRFDDNPLQFDKRASYGFFGMRGKKIPRWEIRGKFIGVRGKKWSPVNLNNGDNPINNGFDNVERIGSKPNPTANFGDYSYK